MQATELVQTLKFRPLAANAPKCNCSCSRSLSSHLQQNQATTCSAKTTDGNAPEFWANQIENFPRLLKLVINYTLVIKKYTLVINYGEKIFESYSVLDFDWISKWMNEFPNEWISKLNIFLISIKNFFLWISIKTFRANRRKTFRRKTTKNEKRSFQIIYGFPKSDKWNSKMINSYIQ